MKSQHHKTRLSLPKTVREVVPLQALVQFSIVAVAAIFLHFFIIFASLFLAFTMPLCRHTVAVLRAYGRVSAHSHYQANFVSFVEYFFFFCSPAAQQITCFAIIVEWRSGFAIGISVPPECHFSCAQTHTHTRFVRLGYLRFLVSSFNLWVSIYIQSHWNDMSPYVYTRKEKPWQLNSIIAYPAITLLCMT